ncbi:aldo/keto reductase [Lactobacillus agrestimuris]|uniref:aldo/keto reductase n=1 Tax=Lactobacillus agrestimuris TaxID=2941328 RepID=UPI0020443AF0|nr:aldo/keto reductase [Lactobacillus agrestimuris]
MKKVLNFAEIKPQVLQAEARKVLEPTGTRLMAWYPLGSGDRSLINESIFSKLAKKYHKTNVQIILRWHTQMGFIVIPGSTNPEHIHDNHNIFDFKLTDAFYI